MLYYEPIDSRVLENLNLQIRLDMLEYEWVDTKVKGTSSALGAEVDYRDANIMVSDPLGL